MSVYDSLTDRTAAQALMPEEVSDAFLKGLNDQSAVLQFFTRVPVGKAQVRFPVLSSLPTAYWVTGDTGLKQTTELSWDNKYLNIEEIAVIVPIPENVINDSDIPIWEQARPLLEQAVGRTLDAAVFFGINAPSSFPDDVVASAIAVGNHYDRGTNNAAAGGLVTDLGNVIGLLEADGYDPDSGIAVRSLRGYVRSARNAQGDRYAEISIDRNGFEIDGVRYMHPMRGLWPVGSNDAEAIVFDSSQFVVGVRQDITYKVLTEAVIQDGSGNIVYNLAQQDMVALRVVMRVGWQVANTLNYDEASAAVRYPAAVLQTP